MEIITSVINPQHLVSTLGLIGVLAIIFLETGVFFGFFFPGDSLLFTAGFFASQGHLSITALLIGTFICAVLGDSFGYAFGKKIGPALFTKEDSIFFNKKHITKAKHFYEQHGKKTIILARFLPIIRTFAPIVAGIGNMEYKTFLAFNVIGGFLWTWSMLLLGYLIGSVIPDPDRFVLPIIILIIIVSAIPTIREILKHRNSTDQSK
jgi:membrane-associated protein